MKTCVLTVTVLLCIAGLSWCQQCGDPVELIKCQAQVTNAGNDFCKILAKLKDCLNAAQCDKGVYDQIKEGTEKGLGIKCGAGGLAVQAVTLILTVLTGLTIKNF